METTKRDYLRPQSGQVLVEFMVFLGPLFFSLVLSARLLGEEWKRTQCAYLTFEKTHARLLGNRTFVDVPWLKFKEEHDRWIGYGNCGKMREVVELPKLEYAHW